MNLWKMEKIEQIFGEMMMIPESVGQNQSGSQHFGKIANVLEFLGVVAKFLESEMKILNVYKPFGEMSKFLMPLEYIGNVPDTLGNGVEVAEHHAHLIDLLYLSGEKMMFLE